MPLTTRYFLWTASEAIMYSILWTVVLCVGVYVIPYNLALLEGNHNKIFLKVKQRYF